MGNTLSSGPQLQACKCAAPAPLLDGDGFKLLRAVKKGDLLALSRHVEAGKELRAATELLSGCTALHIAARAGNVQLLSYMLECPHGAGHAQIMATATVGSHNGIGSSSDLAYLWLNARNRKGYSALTVATRAGHPQAVKLLLRCV